MILKSNKLKMGRTVHPDHATEDATVAKVDIWLADLVKEFRLFKADSETKNADKDSRIKELEGKVKVLEQNEEELKKANEELKLEILELKKDRLDVPNPVGIPKPTELNFSSVFRTNKDDRISEKITISKVAREIRNEAKKENNVVISGLAFESTEKDEQLLDEIMTELSLEKGDMKKQIRLKKRNTSNSQNSNSQNSNSKPPLILVEFNSAENQQNALRNAKNLKNNDKFKNVYVNADRTEIERMKDRVLREERKRRNEKLPNESNGRRYGEYEGKKFYWGVRGDRLQRIECKSQ